MKLPTILLMPLVSLASCAAIISADQPIRVSESGITLHLAQPWNDSPDPGFQPGKVQLSWTPTALQIEADLTDDHVFTAATGDNQKTWDLGDVFEIFIQPVGRRDYVELHVVPTNHRVHAQFPGPGLIASPNEPLLAFDQAIVDPAGFTSTATQTPKGWKVTATIPASVLDVAKFTPGQRLRISFSRYDATPDQDPVLSTTAAHPVIRFHRPEEWTEVELVAD